MTATPTDVLRTHRHLYEVMAEPNPNVVRFYDDFFNKTTETALAGSVELQAAWVSMLYPARGGAEFLQMLRKPLYAAPTFHVTPDIVHAVTGTYERSTQEVKLERTDLPVLANGEVATTGFMWLDDPLFLTDAGGKRLATRAFSWGPQPLVDDGLDLGDGIRLTSWCLTDDIDDFTDKVAAELLMSYDMRLSLSHSQYIPFGSTLRVRDKTVDVTPDDVTRWMHTLWMFMGTEIVQSAPAQTGRPERKRARAVIATDTVNTILLRRVRISDHEVSHRDIDWSCRWIVQAHYRHLEDYSGVAERHHAVPLDGGSDYCAVCAARITRVKAYVKGPDGLPLKPVPETIYRVAR